MSQIFLAKCMNLIIWYNLKHLLYIRLSGRKLQKFYPSYIYPILSFEDDEKLFQSWQNFPDRYGARAL